MSLAASTDPVTTTSFLRRLKWLRTSYFASMALKYSVLVMSIGASVAMTLPIVVESFVSRLWQAIALIVLAPGVAILLTALRAPSLASVARRTDREFRLQDRVATALEHVGSDDEMAQLLLADAERRLPANWKGTRIWNFRNEIRFSVLVLVIPLATALSVRSLIEVALPEGSRSVSGPAARSSDGPEGTGTADEFVAVPAADPIASPSENGRAAEVGVPAVAAGSGSDPVSSGGDVEELSVSSPAATSDARGVAPTSSAGGAGRPDPSPGESMPADVSSAGTSARATTAPFEGMAGAGVVGAPSDVGKENVGGAASVNGMPSERAADFRSALDPRRVSGYSDSWRRAQAIPLAERIPAGLRRYIRDYFAAIEP